MQVGMFVSMARQALLGSGLCGAWSASLGPLTPGSAAGFWTRGPASSPGKTDTCRQSFQPGRELSVSFVLLLWLLPKTKVVG